MRCCNELEKNAAVVRIHLYACLFWKVLYNRLGCFSSELRVVCILLHWHYATYNTEKHPFFISSLPQGGRTHCRPSPYPPILLGQFGLLWRLFGRAFGVAFDFTTATCILKKNKRKRCTSDSKCDILTAR